MLWRPALSCGSSFCGHIVCRRIPRRRNLLYGMNPRHTLSSSRADGVGLDTDKRKGNVRNNRSLLRKAAVRQSRHNQRPLLLSGRPLGNPHRSARLQTKTAAFTGRRLQSIRPSCWSLCEREYLPASVYPQSSARRFATCRLHAPLPPVSSWSSWTRHAAPCPCWT